MILKINVAELVSQDRFEVSLNGTSLSTETCRRTPRWNNAYTGQWLEFDLDGLRPTKGTNKVQFVLHSRPDDFEGEIRVDDVELIIEYGVFPTQKSS